MSNQNRVERRVLVQGVSTLYQEAGEGPAVLLMPGLAENVRSWWRVMQDLSLTHHVLAVVLPGLGGTSPVDDVRPANIASFVSAFLDAVGVERAIVVGHSYGGAVAAHLALAHPQRVTRLVLVDSAGLGRAIHPFMIGLSVLPGRAADMVAHTTTIPGVGALIALSGILLMRQPWHVPLRAWVDEARLVRSRTPIRTSVEVLRQGVGWTGQRERSGLAHRLEEIEAPTLVIWGLTDWVLPVSQGIRAARRLRKGKLTVIAGAGHVCFMDCHEDFMAVLGPFVRDDIDRLGN